MRRPGVYNPDPDRANWWMMRPTIYFLICFPYETMNSFNEFILVIGCLVYLTSFTNGQSQRCDYTVVPSEAGLGLFALHDLKTWNLLEVSVGIPIPMSTIYWTELVNYVEGYNTSHCLLTLGNGLLMNHHHNTRNYVNTWKVMSPHPSFLQFRSPYQSSIDLLYEYTIDVRKGQQLFIDYGFDWFEERSLSYTPLQEFYADQDFDKVFSSLATSKPPSSTTTSNMMNNKDSGGNDKKNNKDWKLMRDVSKVTQALGWPVCNYQYSTYRQGELLANVDIPVGTIIEVSRALLIPVTRSLLFAGPLEEVLWWAVDVDITQPLAIDSIFDEIANTTIRRPSNPYNVEAFDESGTSKYALLLTGRGPFYGLQGPAYVAPTTESERFHSHNTGNVELDFYYFDEEITTKKKPVSCSTQMLVTLKAKRHIMTGEKLTLDYVMDMQNGRRFIGESIVKSCFRSSSIENNPIVAEDFDSNHTLMAQEL